MCEDFLVRFDRHWRWLFGAGVVALGAVVVGRATAQDGFLRQSRGFGNPADIDEWRKTEIARRAEALSNCPAGSAESNWWCQPVRR